MNWESGILGFLDGDDKVYPLGTDTKVLGAAFEMFVRPAVIQAASVLDYRFEEQAKQNFYPDFTLHPQDRQGRDRDGQKIAVDVKTTYRKVGQERFSYTLGSYTSFIRSEDGTGNISYPLDRYSVHLIIGIVYSRAGIGNVVHDARDQRLDLDDRRRLQSPCENVEWFVNDKWRIAGRTPGSGNTRNIGSINGRIADFRDGRGEFGSEDEFLNYWRNY